MPFEPDALAVLPLGSVALADLRWLRVILIAFIDVSFCGMCALGAQAAFPPSQV